MYMLVLLLLKTVALVNAAKNIQKCGEFLDQPRNIRTILLHGKSVKQSLYRPGQALMVPEG